MRLSLIYFTLIILSPVLSGCIFSSAPSEGGVVIPPGESQRFKISVIPRDATFEWFLDDVAVGSNSDTFTYTPLDNGIADHTLVVKASHSQGNDQKKWHVIETSADCVTDDDPEEIKLIFVGDIMLDRGVKRAVDNYGNGSYDFLFSYMTDVLNSADIAFGNLENVISDEGQITNLLRYYLGMCFRADPISVDGLVSAGFDVLSVANNHLGDYGREAMEDSFNILADAGISYVGGGFSEAEAHAPVVVNVNDTSIAYLAYNKAESGQTTQWVARESTSGMAWLNQDSLENDIPNAKDEADLVVVSIHLGDEYFYSPNSDQTYYAHLAIDLGADLVIGHHSHVIQPVEVYEDGFIAYSLGNFVFDQNEPGTMTGLVLAVSVKEKKITTVERQYVGLNGLHQPNPIGCPIPVIVD